MRKLTTEEWVAKAVAVQGDRYDYTQVDYQGNRVKVWIDCRVHGPFLQSPKEHLMGRGCSKPGCLRYKPNATKERFVEQAREVHGEYYDYGPTQYKNRRSTVDIRCPKHGIFSVVVDAHLTGAACGQCSGRQASGQAKVRAAALVFPAKAAAVHDGWYKYPRAVYVGAMLPLTITCPKHGDFDQTPASHLNGRGCLDCVEHVGGFRVSKPGTLYYLRVEGGLYKIGITNRSVEERFSNTDLDKITVIQTWDFARGANALKREQKVKRRHARHRYQGPDVLSSGNTELFTRDVLELDQNGC